MQEASTPHEDWLKPHEAWVMFVKSSRGQSPWHHAGGPARRAGV